jgi:hypothetical protein
MTIKGILLSSRLLLLRYSSVSRAHVLPRLRLLLGCGNRPPLCALAPCSLLQAVSVSERLAPRAWLHHTGSLLCPRLPSRLVVPYRPTRRA